MDASSARKEMIDRQIRARGVSEPRVLAALGTVPREVFVAPELAELAYDDRPLPIEAGQTISQPYVVALMAESLELGPGERALEIGAGSGYAAAVLGRIAKEVYAVERHAQLAELARQRMQLLGYTNVSIKQGDGTLGWPEHAPYDAIAVAASGPDVPAALLEQLAMNGRLVMPIGDGFGQELVRITRVGANEYRHDDLGAVQFVPLIGEQGWTESAPRSHRGFPRRFTG
jgi:protein-L-isoaspartate(D-aspartate) O-methyltransferase